MSFYAFAEFLKSQASSNEELSLVFVKIERELIKIKELEAQVLDHDNLEFHAQITGRMWESFTEDMEELRDELNAIEKAMAELYENHKKQQSMSTQLNFNKAVGYDIMVKQMQWQQGKEEMEEMHSKEKEIHERMENRNIVKKLRETQKEHQEAVKNFQKAKEFQEANLKKSRQELESKKEERNKIITSMVRDAKKLETVRLAKTYEYEQHQMLKKLDDKKSELMTKLHNMKKQQPCTSTSSIANFIQNKQLQECHNTLGTLPIFDARNPMAFLKSLNLSIYTEKIMLEFSVTLQKKEKEKTSEKFTELRPILRNKNDDAESAAVKSSTHHVHFLESESDTSSTLSTFSTSPSNYVQDVNTNLLTSSLQNMPSAASVDAIETINLLTPADEVASNDNSTNEISAEVTASPPRVVDVLECKTLKPAGTSLPKRIPFTLSPIDEDTAMLDSGAAISSEAFKIPEAPKATQMPIKYSKLRNDTDSESTPMENTSNDSDRTQSQQKNKRNSGLDFESFLVVDPNSDNDDDFGKDSELNFDFDMNDNRNIINSDNDEFNFSDSDELNAAAGKNTFDL